MDSDPSLSSIFLHKYDFVRLRGVPAAYLRFCTGLSAEDIQAIRCGRFDDAQLVAPIVELCLLEKKMAISDIPLRPWAKLSNHQTRGFSHRLKTFKPKPDPRPAVLPLVADE